jgi:hypothetical protein
MITKIQDRPRVRGTNRKWYIAVLANCQRDNSIIVLSSMVAFPDAAVDDEERASGRGPNDIEAT